MPRLAAVGRDWEGTHARYDQVTEVREDRKEGTGKPVEAHSQRMQIQNKTWTP